MYGSINRQPALEIPRRQRNPFIDDMNGRAEISDLRIQKLRFPDAYKKTKVSVSAMQINEYGCTSDINSKSKLLVINYVKHITTYVNMHVRWSYITKYWRLECLTTAKAQQSKSHATLRSSGWHQSTERKPTWGSIWRRRRRRRERRRGMRSHKCGAETPTWAENGCQAIPAPAAAQSRSEAWASLLHPRPPSPPADPPLQTHRTSSS